MADRNVEALTNSLYLGNSANRVKINPDGTLELEGTATTWEDLRASLFGRRLDSGPGSVDYNWDENTVTFQNDGNINSSADRVCMNFQMPHKMKLNSQFRFHLHWIQPDATIREFTMQYRVQKNGEAATSAWTSITTDTSGSAFTYVSGNLNQITPLLNLDTTNFGLSAIIQVRLTRSDSESGDIEGLFLDAHYEIDSFGSSEEYVK